MIRLRQATAVMTLGTVLSRITGVIRLAAIAAAIGIVESGRLTDTYNLANTAPNIIYELVLGGILTSIFVPVFVELLEKEGKERAWEVASAMINISLVVLAAVTTIGVVAAPVIANFYAVRAGEQAALQQDILTFLLRLFIPQIIFYGLYAITSGLLNAHKRFAAPMYTPILNNLAVIAVFIAFHEAYGRVQNGLAGVSDGALWVIGVGTTLGVVLQAVAQIPFLSGLGRYRFTFSLEHPSIRKLARLAVFVIGYVAVNQIGFIVVQWLANQNTGGYSAFVVAFAFFMLPHGLFAVSVITALLPGMSESAVNREWHQFRGRLSLGIRATFLLVLPAAVGFFVLATPIIRLLLQHGVMQANSVELVSGVLRFFVIGLVPFSLFQLFLRAFYALQDTKTPFLINCAAVALNTALNVPLFTSLGVKGLAAGHTIAYAIGAALQGRALGKRIGGLDTRRLIASGTRILLASLAMGLLVWMVSQSLRAVAQSGLLGEIAAVLIPVTVGVGAYFLSTVALRVPELELVRGLWTRNSARDQS